MNVTWLKNTKGRLNQESNTFEMCLLKKESDNNYTGITVPVRCKDYFQDSFFIANKRNELSSEFKKQYNNKLEICGYVINFNDPSLDELLKDTLYIGIRYENNNNFENNQNANSQAFMNYYDKLFNISSTKVLQSDDNKTIVFEYSREWTSELYMLSLFTLLARSSVYCTTTDVDDKYISSFINDIKKDYKNLSMWMSVQGKIEMLLNKSKISDRNNTYNSILKNMSTINLHHYTGILSLKFDVTPQENAITV